MRTLVRQQSTVALAAVCLAVPAAIMATQAPAPKIDSQVASHLAPVRSDYDVALAAVSLLDALGLPLEAALWITTANPAGASGFNATTNTPNVPAGVPPLPPALLPNKAGTNLNSYTSLYTVINNAIKILSVPATDLTTGQFGKVITDAQAAIPPFVTSVTTGLPTSVLATLQYVSSQLGGAIAISSASAPTESITSVSTFAAPAAAANPTDGLTALGLPLEAALWITTANPAGASGFNTTTNTPNVPAGVPPLPPELLPNKAGTNLISYTSVYTVANNAIKIISAPATDLTTGQWGKIAPDAQAAINTFNTSLTQGFPNSVAATIGYLTGQLGTSTAGLTTLKVDANKPDTFSAQSDDTQDPGSNVKTTLATPKLKKSPATSGGFLNQLQGAVDKQLGGGSGVKVATKSAADPGSNPSSGEHGLGLFGQKKAKSGDDGATSKLHLGFGKKDQKTDSSATD